MKVQSWISHEQAETLEDSVGGLGGFFQNGMRWKDYIAEFQDSTQTEYLEAIRASVIENNIRYNGNEHQNARDGVPYFEDDTVGTFTFRAWGDLMAAIWSTQEDKDYSYMDFYV